MNKYVTLIAVLLSCIIAFIFAKISSELYIENKRLSKNQVTLMDSIHAYKIADSLNVAKVSALELTLTEYKKYRAEDAELIKKLKADKLLSATSITTTTNAEIKTIIKDSIIYVDKIVPIDTIKQINYNSKWISVNGYITNSNIALNITNREELLVTENLTKKKLWFIKLPIKIFGYKSKSIDVVSKNPNTKISNLEYIQICK